MSRHSVTLVRTIRGNLSPGPIGTAGLTAISTISGVEDPRIENETEDQVEISYRWSGTEKFQTTQEHLAQYGLERMY